MITQAPKREFTLDYPIEKVKFTINDILRLPGHNLLDKNDVLNTYRIALVYSLNTAIENIQLIKVDETKTHCLFEVFNTSGSKLAASVISGMQEKYLKTFTDVLNGQVKIVNKTPEQMKKEGGKMIRNLGIAVLPVIILYIVAWKVGVFK